MSLHFISVAIAAKYKGREEYTEQHRNGVGEKRRKIPNLESHNVGVDAGIT